MNLPNPDARARLFSLEQIGIKLGLDQIRALVKALDEPDRAFPSIIVAGTNGKGSVTAMIERGLRAAGYTTGRYTSPHLVDLEERFAIDGVSISAGTLDESLARVLAASTTLPAPPSFFEATTALALDVFRSAAVDVAVLEVGLGGRLDATNVVTPAAGAITAIDFDHEQFLGHSIPEIAREKAGIVKSGMVVVLAANPPDAEAVVAERCRAVDARLVRAEAGVVTSATVVDGRTRLDLTTPRRNYGHLSLALRGRHQIGNAVVAVRLLEELDGRQQFAVSETAIRNSVEDVFWPARLEQLDGPAAQVLIDGAHNPAGARALASYVLETYGRRVPLVVGVMRDKNIDRILSALEPAASHFVATAPAIARAASPADLLAAIARTAPDVPAHACDRPLDAVALAATLGSPVVVAGSLYLAGEIRAGLA